MKREIIAISILLFIIIVLFFIKNELLNQLYTQTPQYGNIENQVVSLHKQNLELQDQLLYKSSYRYIWTQAHSQGYVPATFVTP